MIRRPPCTTHLPYTTLFRSVTTATIAGVVQDASGAVIPGVTVTAKNVETGATRTATSDEGGRYTVPELTLGDYEVEAQLADRKSTRLNSSHVKISYAVFCLK